MEKIRIEEKRLFDEFQNIWNLEKVKNMTLEEYTGVGSSRNDFTYLIEFKLPYQFGGGDSGMRYGIYKYKQKPKKDYNYDDEYAWLKNLGNNRDEAFKKVLKEIIQVVEFSKTNKIEEIDRLDKILFFGFKWKIAFAYQNFDNMKIGYIFSEKILQNIAKGEKLGNLTISQIHRHYLNDNKQYDFGDMIEKFEPLWNKYGEKQDSENLYQTKEEQEMPNTTKNPPLNQILYGPPGTGKTYSTIDKALEILHHYKVIEKIPESREAKRAIFDEYRANKQIEFVTFHQSFSYEEFVEGIKPKLIDSSEGAESGKMDYMIKSGIFKEICNRALYKEYKSEITEIQANTKTRVWKISIVAKSEKEELRDEVLKHCLEKDEIRIGWSDNRTPERISMLGRNDQSSIYQFENEADIGDIVCVFENANGDIKGIGIIESEFYWDDKVDNSKALKLYPRVRKVKWLSKAQINIRDLNGGTNLTQKTFYPLDRVNAIELLNRIGKLDKKDLVVDNTQKPFVLIIDEINRGNISKILGELITLIEPSKRIGASDEEKARGIGNESLEITLPYSNDKFGVPSNLYIIGTMNTADRSIALLDTALRRRFEFVEMMPECEHKDISTNCKGVNLQELLKTMNERIEFLLDREHTIGHSFFIKVKSLSDLQKVFKNKIVPLLQEYFYDDYAKIDAVLGGNGMVEKTYKSVVSLFQNPKSRPDDLEDKTIYNITPLNSEIWDNPQTYKNIYGGGKLEDSQYFSESDANE